MNQTTITVSGMSCAHCVGAVTEELTAVPGVTAVDVDLRPGDDSLVTITSDEPVDDALIRAAVEEAGYTLA